MGLSLACGYARCQDVDTGIELDGAAAGRLTHIRIRDSEKQDEDTNCWRGDATVVFSIPLAATEGV